MSDFEKYNIGDLFKFPQDYFKNTSGQEQYHEWDIIKFHPSFDYLYLKEQQSCGYCRKEIYKSGDDVSNLSIMDILSDRLNEKKKSWGARNIKKKDLGEELIDKFSKIFSIGKEIPKTPEMRNIFFDYLDKRFQEDSDKLMEELRIAKSLLYSPLFHQCNHCLKAWNIHHEIKERFYKNTDNGPFIFSNWKMENFRAVSLINGISSQNERQSFGGLLLLEEDWSKVQPQKHIEEIREILDKDTLGLLNKATNSISVGDLPEAFDYISAFLERSPNNYLSSLLLQLRSRYSGFFRTKTKGVLSSREEAIEENKISADTISLVEELMALYK